MNLVSQVEKLVNEGNYINLIIIIYIKRILKDLIVETYFTNVFTNY